VLDDRFGEPALHRGSWFTNLVEALKWNLLHQHRTAWPRTLRVCARCSEGWIPPFASVAASRLKVQDWSVSQAWTGSAFY